MTIVALVFTAVVLLYQGWTYWVFRRRLGRYHVTGGAGPTTRLANGELGGRARSRDVEP